MYHVVHSLFTTGSSSAIVLSSVLLLAISLASSCAVVHPSTSCSLLVRKLVHGMFCSLIYIRKYEKEFQFIAFARVQSRIIFLESCCEKLLIYNKILVFWLLVLLFSLIIIKTSSPVTLCRLNLLR